MRLLDARGLMTVENGGELGVLFSGPSGDIGLRLNPVVVGELFADEMLR